MFENPVVDALAHVAYALAALISAVSAFLAAIRAGAAHAAVAEVKDDVRKIELATNSMKDALVQATAKASMAEGEAKGRQDAHDEAKTKALGDAVVANTPAAP